MLLPLLLFWEDKRCCRPRAQSFLGREKAGRARSISILYSFISQMTSCHQEQVWWERGLSSRQGPLLEVMNGTQAQAEDSASPPHPSLLSPKVWIFSSLPHLAWMLPKPSAGETYRKGVCGAGVGGQLEEETRGTSSLGGCISWMHISGWDEPVHLEE